MSMMWRSSKTGEAPPSRDGIGIGPPLSGEASDTHAVTGPMRAVIGREAQELPPSMCCRDAFAPCAITDGSAMPLQMATDPLGRFEPPHAACWDDHVVHLVRRPHLVFARPGAVAKLSTD